MASGYVTSDGKDLDSRYLGISAKSTSASKADTATTATTANTATGLSGNFAIVPLGSQVTFTLKEGGSYTIPANGTMVFTQGNSQTLTINGKDGNLFKLFYSTAVCKGDVVKATDGMSANYRLLKYNITKKS